MKSPVLLALTMCVGLALTPGSPAQTAASTVTTNGSGQLVITTTILNLPPSPIPVPVPQPSPAPLPTTVTSKPTTPFQSMWTTGFLSPIPGTAKWTAIKGGLPHTNFGVDVNYEVLTTNSQPSTPILQDGDWVNRSSGTLQLGTLPFPAGFVLPNPSNGDTPNNPLIVYNTDAKWVKGINGAARPVAGGPLYGYMDTPTMDHGGSGILGGELTDAELKAGINHALAVNVWGLKYLNRTNGGYVSPADKADGGFDQQGGSDFYGSTLPIYMGSRLAISPAVTAQSLGITSTMGKNLLAAMQTYGAIVVDNSAWDCYYINATPDAESDLYALQADIKKMEAVLQVVQ